MATITFLSITKIFEQLLSFLPETFKIFFNFKKLTFLCTFELFDLSINNSMFNNKVTFLCSLIKLQ